jgi:glycosyltransferase involved in cell wall biosynthesis
MNPIRLNGNFHLHHYPGIGRWFQQFRPHIVHIDEEPYNAAAWQAFYQARRAGAKTLFFSWQNICRRYPPPFGWGESWLLRGADAVIAGTESAAAVWRAKGLTAPLAVIPQFGIDPDVFAPSAGTRPPPFTIGYAGRLVAEKGLTLLFEACALLGGDWRLRLIGGGPLRADLAALAARLNIRDRVIWSAQAPSAQMPAFYRQLDVLALPSLTRPNWKEQFGRVLVEAMASGVAVVGSDSGAIPDVIGDAGLVVPEGKTAALAGALRRLRDDPALRAELAARGRARVLAHFTHAQVAEATVNLYRQMLASA